MARILIVDDSKLLRLKTSVALQKAGHEVMQAGDGKEGLKVLKKFKAQLVILDVNMPIMDGWEMLSKLRGARKTGSMLVLMSTTADKVGDIEKAFALGANDYVIKEAQLDKLVEKVNRHLNRLGNLGG